MLKIERMAIPAATRKGKYAETIAHMKPGDCIAFPNRSKAAGFTQSLRRAGFNTTTRNVNGKVYVWKATAKKARKAKK